MRRGGYFNKTFNEKPGEDSNFGCGLDAPYREDSDWDHTVIVTESENSWYSYGLGRNAGVFRRSSIGRPNGVLRWVNKTN